MAAVRRETFVARTIRLWYVHKVMCSVLRGLFLITSLAAYALTSANSQEIRGVVRDVTGFSLNNILVEASVFDSGSFTQLVTTTDLAGRYSFPFSRGDWSIEPNASVLNAIGRLSAGSASVDVTNGGVFIPFTTRQLDLNRLVKGTVRDQFDHPVPGIQLRALINENYRYYETNFITGPDGRFTFGASSAIWRLQPIVGLSSNFFPELSISVEPHDAEKEILVVAPRATTSITGTLTNFSDLELRAECVAFGHRYIRSMWIFEDTFTFDLPVFPGTWTLVATNAPGWITRSSPSAPVTVEVSNAPVRVNLAAVKKPSPVTRTLHLDFVTASGTPITNSTRSVSASQGNGRPSRVLPPPLPVPPGGIPPAPGIRLPLEDGPWRILSTVTLPGMSNSWSVTQPVVISSNGPTNLTVVFPDVSTSPQLLGHVRDTEGRPLSNQWMYISGSVSESNHSAQCVTDENGNFTVPAMPGRWVATMQSSFLCPARATVTVADTNQSIEVIACSWPEPKMSSVTVKVTNDFSDPDIPYWISRSGSGSYFGTNGLSGRGTVLPLPTGLSTISLSPPIAWYFWDRVYELTPQIKVLHDSSSPTNLVLRAHAATARIEGRLRNSHGEVLSAGYATARANIGGALHSVSGEVLSGYFSLNVVPGEWEVAASVSGYPSLNGTDGRIAAIPLGGASPSRPQYSQPPQQFLRVTNGLNRCEFVVEELPAPVPITVAVVTEDGAPVPSAIVSISADSSQSSFGTEPGTNVQFNVRPGHVTISASSLYSPFTASNVLLFPSLNLAISSTGPNHFVLVARSATKCLEASVTNPSGRIVPVPIEARIEINGTNYANYACPASGDAACLSLFPGQWRVGVPDHAVNEFSLESSPAQELVVPNLGEPPPIHFVLNPLDEDFRYVTFSKPTRLPDGSLIASINTKASLVWRIDATEDLEHWTPLFTVTSTNRSALVPLPPASNVRPRFFRAAWIY